MVQYDADRREWQLMVTFGRFRWCYHPRELQFQIFHPSGPGPPVMHALPTRTHRTQLVGHAPKSHIFFGNNSNPRNVHRMLLNPAGYPSPQPDQTSTPVPFLPLPPPYPSYPHPCGSRAHPAAHPRLR